MTNAPAAPQVAEAARALMLLQQQTDDVRVQLGDLEQQIAAAQSAFDERQVARILEANEHLVLAALQSQALAEEADSHFGELSRASQRDALTDTPNRALMLDRIQVAIAMAKRRGARAALLFLDLDRFKPINDSFGHAVGDEALKIVARLLESLVRHSDTVSRHGGDEFLVLLAYIEHAADAGLIADKMVATLADPRRIGAHVLDLRASIGIAIYPDDGDEALTLIAHADAAMYRAKQARSGYAFHGDTPAPAPGPTPRREPIAAAASSLNVPDLRDLREANEQLTLAALTAQTLQADAEQVQRRQVEFLAILAHELRNPLSPIQTSAALLSFVGTDEKLLPKLQGVIERQAAHLSRLLDDLLDGSRIGTGQFRIEPGRVDLGVVLGTVAESGRAALDRRQQRFSLRMPPGVVVVRGDAVRLAQIFGNLLDNASKYTPEGGTIAVELVASVDVVEVSVVDNGIGIGAEMLPQVFELFTQDAQARHLHRGGLGIGLAVVRDLVHAHGGQVRAESAGADRGSRFVVTLPRLDGAATLPA